MSLSLLWVLISRFLCLYCYFSTGSLIWVPGLLAYYYEWFFVGLTVQYSYLVVLIIYMSMSILLTAIFISFHCRMFVLDLGWFSSFVGSDCSILECIILLLSFASVSYLYGNYPSTLRYFLDLYFYLVFLMFHVISIIFFPLLWKNSQNLG